MRLPFAVRYAQAATRNVRCAIDKPPDYVWFSLEGSYPPYRERKGPFWRRWFSPPRRTLEDLNEELGAVAADTRLRGVIVSLGQIFLSWPHLRTLRSILARVKEREKKVIVWATKYDMGNYYLASIADSILLQPGGSVGPLGLARGFIFLGDALNRLGVKADFLAVSPYKSAADMLTRSEMSEQAREMANWVISSQYDSIVTEIGQSRGLTIDEAKAFVDESPYTDLEALKNGLVDRIVRQDEIASIFRDGDERPSVMPWRRAKSKIPLPLPSRSNPYIALVPIRGDIVDGRSQHPPIKVPSPIPFMFRERAGDISVVRQLRKALADRHARGCVLYIDSGGGSATASYAIASAVFDLAKKKPVVAVMGATAASGGYYVAASANWIIAQPTTITGSIGVITGKIWIQGLLEKLSINQEVIFRGENALLYHAKAPFSNEQREKVKAGISRTYDLFVEQVSAGRKMDENKVRSIGGGRVWTGAQALELGLIDELGDLFDGLRKVCELSGLPKNTQLRPILTPNGDVATKTFGTNLWEYAIQGVQALQGAGDLCLNYWFLTEQQKNSGEEF